MSKAYFDNPILQAKADQEARMYHFIMQNGKLDNDGILVEPPQNMSAEETAYYEQLLRERNGKIQYTV